MKNRALVLSGGSIKGAFQAGAVAETLGSGFIPDAIYGVSVGSLNGAFLTDRAGRAALRNETPDWPKIGEDLATFWKEKITSFDEIGDTKSGLGLAYDVIFNDFSGLVDTSKLQHLIRSEIQEVNLRSSPVNFSAGVVNLANGDYLSANLGFPDLLDYIIASTAIPVMMPISMVAGQPLVDGGLRNVTPLKSAIDDHADEIVCIVCQAEKVSGANFDQKNLLRLFDRLMDISINEIVNNDLEWAQYINLFCPRDGTPMTSGPLAGYRYIPITVIRPAIEPDIDIQNFTSMQIQDLIMLGRFTARHSMKTRSQT